MFTLETKTNKLSSVYTVLGDEYEILLKNDNEEEYNRLFMEKWSEYIPHTEKDDYYGIIMFNGTSLLLNKKNKYYTLYRGDFYDDISFS